jgi:hypothetical protein
VASTSSITSLSARLPGTQNRHPEPSFRPKLRTASSCAARWRNPLLYPVCPPATTPLPLRSFQIQNPSHPERSRRTRGCTCCRPPSSESHHLRHLERSSSQHSVSPAVEGPRLHFADACPPSPARYPSHILRSGCPMSEFNGGEDGWDHNNSPTPALLLLLLSVLSPRNPEPSSRTVISTEAAHSLIVRSAVEKSASLPGHLPATTPSLLPSFSLNLRGEVAHSPLSALQGICLCRCFR